ncbi:MAG: hypothetical protein JWQ29_3049 [Phenylobacterium sp.]|nr:hypothetical protein [Phenylobacterium sp.]
MASGLAPAAAGGADRSVRILKVGGQKGARRRFIAAGAITGRPDMKQALDTSFSAAVRA